MFSPSVFLLLPVINYMLSYSTLLCKKIARAHGGHKRYLRTKLVGRNRIDPKRVIFFLKLTKKMSQSAEQAQIYIKNYFIGDISFYVAKVIYRRKYINETEQRY